ncbi:phage tail tape measure protein [Mesorhizobium sp. M0078]|uniref:phage tail tape measure protein n=1 Tax=Mesorhizobium sp. M0078 TaxID=2956871 RepID=UPI00333A451B
MAATIKQRIELDGGKELKRELEEFGAAGRKAFRDLQTAAAQTKGLSPGFFNSLKQAEVQIKALGVQFAKTGKQIQDVGRSLTTSLTLPIVGVGAGVLKVSGDFQKAMNNFAVNAGIAGDALNEARDKAKELGVASVFSTTEAAEGMTELAKVGIEFQTIMGGAAKAMVDLAAANDTGLAASAGVIGDVINQFKLSASQLPAVVDQITGATIQSKLSFDDYRLAIGQAGGAAGALGVNFEQFNAVLAATASSFASGSDAGTSFKTFLTRLVPQSKQAAAMMDKLGLKFFDASGKMKSMSEIAQELQDKLGKLSQEDLNDAVSTIFGTDALRTAIALMAQGGKGIDSMMAHLKNTDSADIAATRVKGFNGELNKLGEALSNLGIAIGDSGFLKFATDIVIKLTDWTTALATVNPEMLRFGTIIGGIVASIGPLLFGLGLATRAFGVTLQGVAALVGGFRLLSTALLFLGANPIIAALALVGVTIALWTTRTSEATTALRVHEELIGKVGSAYDQAGRKVAEMSQQVKDAALIQARLSQEAAGKGLSSAIDEAVNSIQQFDGLLPHAADQLFEVFKQFQGTKDVEAFRAEVAKIGAANPELGKLAQQFLDITENAHKLTQDAGESANFIGLLTGKLTDSEFAAKQAALGIAGYGNDAATAGAKASAAVDENAKKVGELNRQITVFRGGGAGGKLTKEVFDVVDGVAKRAEEGKQALDGLKGSVDATSGAVDGVSNEITNSISTIAPAAQEAAGAFNSSLGNLDSGAAQAAAEAIVAPFETLPGKLSAILSGMRALLQGGFSGLAGIVNSLAAQVESAIARILASLRAAAAAAQSLRAAAGSSSSSDGGGSHGGFARGGHLAHGPGTGTSDSILARLSVGEFVIRAKVVKALGADFFAALNAGVMPDVDAFRSLSKGFSLGGLADGLTRGMAIPRFAGGGFADLKLAGAPAGSGGTMNVKLDFGLGVGDVFDLVTDTFTATRLQQFSLRQASTSAGRRPGGK